jgi:hypothetical protein
VVWATGFVPPCYRPYYGARATAGFPAHDWVFAMPHGGLILLGDSGDDKIETRCCWNNCHLVISLSSYRRFAIRRSACANALRSSKNSCGFVLDIESRESRAAIAASSSRSAGVGWNWRVILASAAVCNTCVTFAAALAEKSRRRDVLFPRLRPNSSANATTRDSRRCQYDRGGEPTATGTPKRSSAIGSGGQFFAFYA